MTEMKHTVFEERLHTVMQEMNDRITPSDALLIDTRSRMAQA